jgi:hypothetical protein
MQIHAFMDLLGDDDLELGTDVDRPEVEYRPDERGRGTLGEARATPKASPRAPA